MAEGIDMHLVLTTRARTHAEETASARTRHAELLILCARMGFNP
jgi:hypothetical protein